MMHTLSEKIAPSTIYRIRKWITADIYLRLLMNRPNSQQCPAKAIIDHTDTWTQRQTDNMQFFVWHGSQNLCQTITSHWNAHTAHIHTSTPSLREALFLLLSVGASFVGGISVFHLICREKKCRRNNVSEEQCFGGWMCHPCGELRLVKRSAWKHGK